jgi:poly(A) polymerase
VTVPAQLGDAAWLKDGEVARLLIVLNRDGEEARVVGGAVRNALLRLPVAEIDVATTAVPDEVVQRVQAAGWKAVPTGIEHGTVTVVINNHPFEVTTLREDIETFGRRARVRFGRDWRADAERRGTHVPSQPLDAITAFTVPNPNCTSQRRRFFQVWLPRQVALPRLITQSTSGSKV